MIKKYIIITTIILFCIVIAVIFYKICMDKDTSGNIVVEKGEINSLEELGSLVKVKFNEDKVSILDINVEYLNNNYEFSNTIFNILYEVSSDQIKQNPAYIYKTDYNPLPSYQGSKHIDNDTISYLKSQGIDKKQIKYYNALFSTYRVNYMTSSEHTSVREMDYAIYVYIIESMESNNYIILISTTIPYEIICSI